MMRHRRGLKLMALATAAGAALARSAWGSTSFTSGSTTGTIQNAAITEASGIVASRMNANVLWTHDDSGSAAQVYAMTPGGVNLGTYTVTGAGASDWEDIAIGPGPVGGTQYIYIGDIGDNLAARATVAVYRVAEPVVSDVQSPVTTSIAGMTKFTFAYPDGPRDAESLFVDPLSRDIYIITKREATKYVYRAAYPQSSSGTTIMERVTTLSNSNWITAADISPDGDEIIMRAGATDTGLLYVRPAGGSVADALGTTPISIPLLSETQGEAIGFDPSGWGYYTTSEGSAAPIHYYNRMPPPGAVMYWDNDGTSAGSRVTSGAGLGGSGSWDASAAKWYNGSADVAWANENDAVLWGTAGTVTLTGAKTVNSLSFKSSGYLVTGSTLTLGGPSINVDGGVTATIKSALAGTVGLTKNGAGILALGTANSYSGGTIINGGVLGIVSNALGAIPSSPVINVTIDNGATLRFDITGLTVAVNRQFLLGAGGGQIDSNGNNVTIAGIISGSSLTKVGSGTLSLTGANVYTGATSVSAGMLRISQSFRTGGSLAIANSAKVLTTARGGGGVKTLQVDTLNLGATGALDLADNDLVVNAASFTTIRNLVIAGYGNTTGITSSTSNGSQILALFDNALVGAGSWNGQSIPAGATVGKYTYFGDMNIDGQVTGDDYTVIDANLNTTPLAGLAWLSGDANLDGAVTGDDYTVIDANLGLGAGNPLTISALPEPAGVGLGLMGFVVALGRRHKKAKRLNLQQGFHRENCPQRQALESDPVTSNRYPLFISP